VPSNSAGAARAIAARHGVSERDFERYPAFGAIVDSVVLGRGLPLDAATAVEMRQFLRLMFDPVAGNMVRTLFLNRQRADRELAPPPELRVERIRHGEWSAEAKGWSAALAQSKLACAADPALPRDTIELEDSGGIAHRAEALSLPDADDRRIAAAT